MKKLLVLLLIALLLPSVALAGKTLPFNHESMEFVEKYNSGFDDSLTQIDEWNWVALEDDSYAIEIIPYVTLFVLLDEENGNIKHLFAEVPATTDSIDLSKEPYVVIFLMPIFYRMLNLFNINNPEEIDKILNDLNFFKLYNPYEYKPRTLILDDLYIMSRRVMADYTRISLSIAIK